MSISLRMIKLLFVMLALAAIGTAVVVTLQRTTRPDPHTAFWSALEHNMTETGVTCTIDETAGDTSTRQVVSLDLKSKVAARSVTTMKQAKTSATTEEITTNSGTFVRYTAITTDKKAGDGSALDFSNVLNKWGKSTAVSSTEPTIFGRTALGNCIVPLASLSNDVVKPFIVELQKGKIFETNFTKVTEIKLQGAAVRQYTARVQPQPYVAFMKQVAEVYGLKDLDTIETATYQTKTPENLIFSVDSDSSRLVQITSVDKQRTVTFTDYGKVPDISAPATSIPATELQKELAEIR